MSTELCHRVERIVEKACAAETNVFGYGIWTHHITDVVANGRCLAPLFEADAEIVEVAALLHDYASVKDVALYPEHHVHGPIEAEKLLRRLEYPSPKIEAVCHAIATHRASVPVERRSREAECLANADAMAHIQNVTSLLHLVYVRRHEGIDEGAAWVRAKLERSWHKLSPRVRDRVDDDYRAALRVLRQREAP
ncbi:MAG: HD domain-containing protein [Acidobacteriota bacterium]